MKVMVTGGCGFIGSAVCRHLVGDLGFDVVNLDVMTYAATTESTAVLANDPRYRWRKVDIRDDTAVLAAMRDENVDAVMHLAAESHVDRSIDAPRVFAETNVMGTCAMLQAARRYIETLPGERRHKFRFHHVSTDEVFGDLVEARQPADESTAYAPSSPYAASKAAADHFVMSWHRTYGLPVVLSNSTNNYGPYQFPEKLIPLMIVNAIESRSLPVYGTGANVRDWMHVDDHARALAAVLTRGRVGTSYNVGARNEHSNLAVVQCIADLVDERLPSAQGPRRALIEFVPDRPGHDRRYALDPSRIERELGWRPTREFATGLRDTIEWYVQNKPWWEPLRASRYRGERLGATH